MNKILFKKGYEWNFVKEGNEKAECMVFDIGIDEAVANLFYRSGFNMILAFPDNVILDLFPDTDSSFFVSVDPN